MQIYHCNKEYLLYEELSAQLTYRIGELSKEVREFNYNKYTNDKLEFLEKIYCMPIYEITEKKESANYNTRFNILLQKNAYFNYDKWRQKRNLSKINSNYKPRVTPSKNGWINKFHEYDDFINILNYFQLNLPEFALYLKLLNKEGLISFLSDYSDLKHSFVLNYPLSNRAALKIYDNKSYETIITLCHELGHVYLGFIRHQTLSVYDMEFEEYVAHVFEASLLFEVFNLDIKWYLDYLMNSYYLSLIYHEFQKKLYLNPYKFKSEKSKNQLFKFLIYKYGLRNVPLDYWKFEPNLLEQPFQDSVYLLPKKNLINIIEKGLLMTVWKDVLNSIFEIECKKEEFL